jgi:hypothetical protein
MQTSASNQLPLISVKQVKPDILEEVGGAFHAKDYPETLVLPCWIAK